MDSNNPKVSFIPKGSLVRDESFLARSRPRSLMGFLASGLFIAAVGAYFGLHYYNNQLDQSIAEKTLELENVQKKFNTSPEVSEAKVFLVRANLARALLDSHTVLSPVFTFLSKNTTENIFYNKFSFKDNPTGSELILAGEAPSYAALAYQADIFHAQIKTLQKFAVNDITLTRAGTITFSFDFVFNPSFLLYSRQLGSVDTGASQSVAPGLPDPATLGQGLAGVTSTSSPSVDSSATSSAAAPSAPLGAPVAPAPGPVIVQ